MIDAVTQLNKIFMITDSLVEQVKIYQMQWFLICLLIFFFAEVPSLSN